ncbi:MAG: hypothetical protein ACE5IH_07285 [Thermodesulfobacteriota bacterium]
MRIIKLLFNLIIILVLASLSKSSLAYKVSTHRIITKGALGRSQNYDRFINDFNVDRTQANNEVIDGSELEDGENESDRRWFNHYYDPINVRGLYFFTPSLQGGRISKEWGYNGGSGLSGYPFSNDYSWIKAREYMYITFTGNDFNGNIVAPTQNERDNYSKLMFRSIGQVIHLVEDMVQPSHVRNDPHVSHGEFPGLPYVFHPSRLEDWAKNNDVTINNIITQLSGYSISLPSFDDYFDYLALFSNQNFYSDDTILVDLYVNCPVYLTCYTDPAYSDTNYTTDFIPFGSGMIANVQAEDGTIEKVPYLIKTGGVVTGHKLAQVGYFGQELGSTGLSQLAFQIDDIVAFENASVLIPKAVEYSSGLLNYFFRGEVGIVAIEEVITGQNITGLNLTIKNLTTNEDMSNGNVEVAYRYKPQGATVFTYGLSNMVASGSIPYQSDAAYTFTFSNPIPVSATEVQYTWVFKGTLGQEVGALVGKVATIDNTGFIFTSGGDSFDLASPGNGGNVTMEAGVVVSPIAAAASLIVPYGSTVTLSGVQEFLTIRIDGTVDATSSLTLRASTGFFLNKGGLIKVEDGIDGGALTIESTGTIAINGVINTSGKNAASGNGGNGGDVTIRTSYTEPLQVPTIITRGGDTDTSDCPNRQVNPPVLCTSYIAGNGGDIVITSAGDIIFSGAATDDSAYIHDTLPPPPPYTLGTPDKPRPDPGERLPLLITDFRKGLLTSGGIGGSGTGSGFTAGGGGTGGDGGKIYISSTGGDIIFRDIDLFTGGDIEAVEADIYLPSVGQYPFFAYTGSLGGKGTGGGGARGADGGMGGRGGDIEIAQGQLNPLPVSFTSTAILGHNGENPNYYDNLYIGKTVTAFDTSGRQLYRLKVFDDGGVDKTLGGSGGFPGGSVFAFPGWFGLRGMGGIIINLPTM